MRCGAVQGFSNAHELDISFSYRNDLESDNLEVLWCDILMPKSKPVVVGACYRPPKQNDFIEKLEDILF